MKIKYLNLTRNYKNTKLYKTTKKMLLIISMSALIGSSNNVEAQSDNQDTTIELDSENIDEKDSIIDEVASIVGEISDKVISVGNVPYSESKVNSYPREVPKRVYFDEIINTEPHVVEEREGITNKPLPIDPPMISTVEEIVDERKLVALTFDDGPGKYTMDLIDILEENNAKATFFLLGPCVERYPDTVVYMYEKGNEIANHGYSHKEFTKMSIEDIQNEIDLTEQLIESYGVECTDFVRPPYRSINDKIIENIDSTFIVWSIDTEDWKSRDVECIKETIIGKIKEGDIILLHDIHKTTVDAIAEILPELTDEYRFVTVSELFELKEVEYEKNKMYSKVKK